VPILYNIIMLIYNDFVQFPCIYEGIILECFLKLQCKMSKRKMRERGLCSFMIKDFHFCPFCGTALISRELEGLIRRCCSACDFVHFKNPLPSAAGVVIRDGSVLLIKRGIEPGKGHWSLPSGFIEEGETPGEGCIREVREETGLETTVIKLLDVFHVTSNFYGEVLVIVYLLEEIGGDLQAGTDAEDVRFFHKNDMPFLHVRGFTNVVTEILPHLDD